MSSAAQGTDIDSGVRKVGVAKRDDLGDVRSLIMSMKLLDKLSTSTSEPSPMMFGLATWVVH